MDDLLNRILCGDNATVLRERFPDNSIDLTVTSPPYDRLRVYHGFTWDFEAVAQQLYRVTKPGGVVVWVVGDATMKGSETGTSFRQALYFKEIGFNLHDTMIYEKTNPLPLHHNRYQPEFEYMFVLSKGPPRVFRPILESTVGYTHGGGKRLVDGKVVGFNSARGKKEKYRGNIWSYAVGGSNDGHPAIFPEQLAIDHILSWSNPGDVILDPFMGSGTTAVAALKTGRSFIGVELSDEYCDLARQCVARAQAQARLQV